jgi:hypothetical protein
MIATGAVAADEACSAPGVVLGDTVKERQGGDPKAVFEKHVRNEPPQDFGIILTPLARTLPQVPDVVGTGAHISSSVPSGCSATQATADQDR